MSMSILLLSHCLIPNAANSLSWKHNGTNMTATYYSHTTVCPVLYYRLTPASPQFRVDS